MQARAYFQIIAIGSTHPRLLAIGGHNGTSALETSEWWEEEESYWRDGPSLSTARSNFAAVMSPPNLVCSEIDPPDHSCPPDQENSPPCTFPAVESGVARNKQAEFSNENQIYYAFKDKMIILPAPRRHS